jgi:hypothetical protein
MAYKNSDGNTGARAEFYNWKYFNSSLKRLEDYKPSNINVNTQLIKPKPEADWMGLIDASMRNYQNVKDVKTAFNAKKLEKLEKITNEFDPKEWDTKFKEAGIDMTSDKLALDYKAYQTGRIVEGLARQDFIENQINKGVFKDKTPWEIDLAYKQYVTESVGLLGDNFKGISENDWFRKGAFGEGIKSREGIIGKALLAQRDQNGRESKINVLAGTAQLIAQGASPKEVEAYFNENNKMGTVFYGEEGARENAMAMFKNLSGQHNGAKYISYFADKEMAGTGGRTYREVLGDTVIQTMINKSVTEGIKIKGKEHVDFMVKANRYVLEGNVEALDALINEYNRLDTEAGGDERTLSSTTTELMGMREKAAENREKQRIKLEEENKRLQEQARKQQEAEFAKSQKALEKAEKDARLNEATLRMVQDGAFSNNVDVSRPLRESEMSSADFSDRYNKLVDEGLIPLDQQIAFSLNRTIPKSQNPALKNNQRLLDLALSDIDKWVEIGYLGTEPLPKDLPENIANIVAMYEMATEGLIQTFVQARRSKQSHAEIFKNLVEARRQKANDKLWDGKQKYNIANELVKDDLTGTDVKLDGFALNEISSSARILMDSKRLKAKDAVAEAKELFFKNNFSFLGTTIPKALSADGNITADEFIAGISSRVKADLIDRKLDGLQGYYDHSSGMFTIVDTGNATIVKSYSQNELLEIKQLAFDIKEGQAFYDKQKNKMDAQYQLETDPNNRYKSKLKVVDGKVVPRDAPEVAYEKAKKAEAEAKDKNIDAGMHTSVIDPNAPNAEWDADTAISGAD